MRKKSIKRKFFGNYFKTLIYRWREEFVESSHFHTNKDIDKLISETETTVTSELEGGDRQKAMKRLRVPPLGDKHSPWTTFKVAMICYLKLEV